MPVWAWILVAILVVAVLGVVASTMFRRRRQTKQLRSTFGPEYDRTVKESDRKEAESELLARQRRRQELDIQPLDPAGRQRYAEQWQETQAQFVDSPAQAVRRADLLVVEVMRDRGYPMDNFERRSADVSVDHPHVVENYRAAHAISMASDHEKATTEDLRQAMVHYRELFEELLGRGEGETRQTG